MGVVDSRRLGNNETFPKGVPPRFHLLPLNNGDPSKEVRWYPMVRLWP